MRIPISEYRRVMESEDSYEVAELITTMMRRYLLSFDDAYRKLREIFQAKNFPTPGCFQSVWNGRIYPSSIMSMSVDGLVSDYEAQTNGLTCRECETMFRQSSSAIHSFFDDNEDQSGYICTECGEHDGLHFWSDGSVHEEEETMPIREEVLNLTAEHYDTVVFPTKEHLWSNYNNRNAHSEHLDSKPTDKVQRYILQYSSNPLTHRKSFLFKEEENLPINPLWLGVELECAPNDIGNKTPGFFFKVANTLKDFTIIKHDGSLSQGGFEIVSVPATLDKHKELWASFFETAAPLLRSWGTSFCGMHVHMNKAFMTPAGVGKALEFVNSVENRKFITLVAGRGAVGYSQYLPKKAKDNVNTGTTSHTDALSISPRNLGTTAELRIFRGNVSPGGFFKNLEFTDALAHWANQASVYRLSASHFLSWIIQPENRARYPYFIGWAQKQEIFSKFPLPKTKEFENVSIKFSTPKTKELVFEDTSA